ncbi:Xylulose 5-phosphate/phosphate translocator, chloroplastic [Frankliniella fusca]|uniref:Xylulose 5-phosphate/phosphate translocator, chloroplastic n=1 Tax=Frankliniella fusca TaxID=407009 RepID=A0AAE1HP01_9NEOP|nr:Xylulose 5-phosphate/phosphate translocator, chloroplastic [Frankliniella fusca]
MLYISKEASIVISPGNLLIVTVMPTHNVRHHVQEFTAKRYYHTLCELKNMVSSNVIFIVASKCSPWYRETESMRPLLKNQTDLDHHIVINEIPGNLQSIVDLTIKEISNQMQNVMSIREEPIHDSKTGPSEGDLLNYGDNEEGTLRCNIAEETFNGDRGKQQMIKKEQCDEAVKFNKQEKQVQRTKKSKHINVQRKSWKLLKYSKYPNSFRFTLLHCPKCDKEFRFGLYGNGLMYLIGHIYENHKRLTSYCMSTIRRKYANVIYVAG